jgi:hypothetical protein
MLLNLERELIKGMLIVGDQYPPGAPGAYHRHAQQHPLKRAYMFSGVILSLALENELW